MEKKYNFEKHFRVNRKQKKIKIKLCVGKKGLQTKEKSLHD